ncbi:MAG: NUDIX hydrolase [Dehalococcoidia bacterium]|nr:MAG: NUDIX hydrolase [Dehalococcoidia bacterium]
MEETLSSQEIYKGRILNLRIDKVRLSSGRCTKREIIEHSNCVAIVAVDENDNVLLVKQFRKPVERELLEIPAGCIEEGEEVEVTVIREMREETGYRPQKVKRLGGFYSTPGYCTEYLHLYLATDLIVDELHAEDTDEIELVLVPLHEIAGLISAGSINDAKSIIGLLLYLASR